MATVIWFWRWFAPRVEGLRSFTSWFRIENRGPVGDLYQMPLTFFTSSVFLFTSKMSSQIFVPLTCGVFQSSLSDISHSLPVLESWMSEWVKVKNLYRTSWVLEMPSVMWWGVKLIRVVSVHRKLDSLNSFGTQIPTSVDVKHKQRDELFTNARISKLYMIYQSFSCNILTKKWIGCWLFNSIVTTDLFFCFCDFYEKGLLNKL